MTSVRDIHDFLDSLAPFAAQMAFDNSGLQCGGFDAPVASAMVCLDVTPGVVVQAVSTGCELVVTHHPVLFRARKQLPSHDPAWLLARHGIACVASHTPLDICEGGVNDLLAERLGLGETSRLSGPIRLCTLPEPLTAKALADRVARRLGAPVRYCDAGRPIAAVALCGGQGDHFLGDVIGHADAYITGDAGHHDFLEAAQQGLSLVAAGHFETEIQLIPALAERLRAAFPAVEWHIANECGGIKYA